MNKMVILGNRGFLGSNLHRHFEKSGCWQVQGFSSKEIDLRDFSNLQVLENVVDQNTVLIVTSAITRERGDTYEDFITNTSMMTNTVRFLESHSVGMCVYLSSISVYGDPETNLFMHEETKIVPESYYALAKHAGEFILQEAAKRLNFPALILRASRIYGPGDSHITYGPNQFIQTIMEKGKVFIFGEGEELRDHLYVDDFIFWLDKLVLNQCVGVYNVVTGKSVTFSEIVQVLKDILPSSFEVIRVERRKPLIHQQYDNQKLMSVSPEFRFTELKEGLRETFASFVRRSDALPLSGR